MKKLITVFLVLSFAISCNQEDDELNRELERQEYVANLQSQISDFYATRGFFNYNEDDPFEFTNLSGDSFTENDRIDLKDFLISIGFEHKDSNSSLEMNGRVECESYREVFYDGWLCWMSVTSSSCWPGVQNCWSCWLGSGETGCNYYPAY